MALLVPFLARPTAAESTALYVVRLHQYPNLLVGSPCWPTLRPDLERLQYAMSQEMEIRTDEIRVNVLTLARINSYSVTLS